MEASEEIEKIEKEPDENTKTKDVDGGKWFWGDIY